MDRSIDASFSPENAIVRLQKRGEFGVDEQGILLHKKKPGDRAFKDFRAASFWATTILPLP
jgi:hypothetical protein